MAAHNLPQYGTPFVGRVTEIGQITSLLNDPDCRLLTLVGPGGIGKTRLAIEGARRTQDAFADGIYLVSLQPLASPDFIVPALAEAIGFQLFSGGEPKRQLLDYLREKSLLLVLDNFEHLLDGAAFVGEVLAQAPQVKVLATTRERLNLLEEWVLDVPGLAAPATKAESDIDDYDAVRLFLQSAQRAQAAFTLTDAHKPAVARICQLVGGMPLGIEMAAAWVRALSCVEIAAEIERSLDLLATSARNVPPRHRTMRAVLDHSWNLLADTERAAFQRLSVFWGGFRKEAAQEVADVSLRTLLALVNKSLLRVDTKGRYDLHELLRQYADEKLAQAGEAQTYSDRHRDYFLVFAERAGRGLFSSHQVDWFADVETELSNVRAAIAWSARNGNIPETLRLTGSLYRFWAERNYHHEGYEQLLNMLSRPEARERSVLRAMALNAAGYIQWFEGHNAEARLLLEEALDIAREVGDQRQIALAVRTLGPVLYGLGEYQAAGLSLEESLLLAHQLRDHYGIAWSLMFLGDVALQAGNPEQAQRFYQDSIDLLTELEDAAFLAYANRRLGLVVAGDRDYERGKALCRASLELNVAIRDRRAVAASLVALAGLAVMQGLTVHGTQLLSAAERVLSSIAAHLLLTDLHEYERHLETVRGRLDTPTFDRAWAEGQSMSMDQAVSYALEEAITLIKAEPLERVDEQALTQSRPLPDALTARELEILHLMARGMSNREIAVSLILSVGTVKWYGSQICSKLHAQNRVQAIVRARELHILP